MIRSAYHPPDLEEARQQDPRLGGGLTPEMLDLVVEEMLDVGLDPNVIDREVYLRARGEWLSSQNRDIRWLRRRASALQYARDYPLIVYDDFLRRLEQSGLG